MAQPEFKIRSLQERLAEVQSLRGVQKWNRVTMTGGLPRGSIGLIDIATADNIRRYADAIGDFNPRFRDPDYAEVTKYGRLVAQPTFLACAAHHLDHHAHYPEVVGRPNDQNERGRSWSSEDEWEYFLPVLEDDRLDINGVGLIDAKIVKSEFSGEIMATTSICQYRNHRGEALALAKGIVLHPSDAQVPVNLGKYDLTKPYRYSDEEIAKIDEDRKKEEMRGSRPRYWEDVNEGESLGHIVVGPWNIMSVFAWEGATGLRGIRFPFLSVSGAGPGFYDSRINARTMLTGWADSDIARSLGAPGCHDIGAEREGLASILFTNWMGDDGFLWKYSIQFLRFVVFGDTCWYRGKIVKKYIDDGKYCVDIEHWGDNQRGDKVTIGKATIILPSKVGGQVKYPAPRSIEDVFPGK